MNDQQARKFLPTVKLLPLNPQPPRYRSSEDRAAAERYKRDTLKLWIAGELNRPLAGCELLPREVRKRIWKRVAGAKFSNCEAFRGL